MRRHRLLVVPVFAALLTGCGGDAASPPEPDAASDDVATVTIDTFDFQPDPLVVAAGTTITFTNEDKIDHTVTAGTREAPTPDVFDGELPEQGSTFDLTLEEPGTYEYFCRIHPGEGMTATITVE